MFSVMATTKRLQKHDSEAPKRENKPEENTDIFQLNLLQTLRVHRFRPQAMLQVFHTDVLPVLTRVPKVQRDIIDGCSADVTVETAKRRLHKYL